MNRVEVSWINLEKPRYLQNLKSFVKKVLQHLEKDSWNLSILMTDNSYIQDLNKRYRNLDEPTDILTFSQLEGETFPGTKNNYVGDMAISLEKVSDNAMAFEVSEEEEFKRVLIHGILHLMGLDHAGNDANQQMIILQEAMLKEFKGERIL